MKRTVGKTTQQMVVEYFTEHPDASYGKAAAALGVSKSTIGKFKPNKMPPPTEEELREFAARYYKEQALEKKLSFSTMKEIRDINLYRMHPIDWRRIRAYYASIGKEMPFPCRSLEELYALIKEVCDGLYGWSLYDKCPVCGKGLVVPVWHGMQAHPYCACTEYPECDYSMDRNGQSVGYRTKWACYHRPFTPRWAVRTEHDPEKILCIDVETTGLYPG